MELSALIRMKEDIAGTPECTEYAITGRRGVETLMGCLTGQDRGQGELIRLTV